MSYRDLVADSFAIERLDVGRSDGRVHARGDLGAANVLLGRLGFDRLVLSADYRDSLSTAGFTFVKGGASVSGRVNSSVVGDTRTLAQFDGDE